jgi:hypothetical protein
MKKILASLIVIAFASTMILAAEAVPPTGGPAAVSKTVKAEKLLPQVKTAKKAKKSSIKAVKAMATPAAVTTTVKAAK